jgi:hypothetical protein
MENDEVRIEKGRGDLPLSVTIYNGNQLGATS